jgi:CRP/FNR family transcriptional regulator, cyclic AMP receptor protein
VWNKKQRSNPECVGNAVAKPITAEAISLEERVQLLAQVPLFCELSKRHLKRLASSAIQREYPSGTTIVRQGDPGVGLYLLIRGRALVWQSLPNGTDRRLAILGSSELFGEMALLDGVPRSASVTAREATSALVIPIFAFRALLYDEAAIAIKLLAVLSRRIRQAESAER